VGWAIHPPYFSAMPGRLRSTAEFDRLKREGRFWRGSRCSINAARRVISAEGNTGTAINDRIRVGYITSRKIGFAVQRNRARRMMREAIRSLEMTVEPGWDIVVIARPAISAPGVRMQHVRDELLWLLKKAQLIQPG
jgi:ribonuclease P protein component